MIVKNGKLKDGITDISKYLGLEENKTIYLHSVVFDKEDITRPSISKSGNLRGITRGGMLYAEILSFLSSNNNGSYAACCYHNKDLIEYLDKEEVINKDKIIFVSEDKKIEYPFNSPSFMLNKKIKEDENLRKRLNGFTIVPSFVSKYDEESAKLINGKLLMQLEGNYKYTSKYWFRKLANKDNFSVLPGFAFKGIKELKKVLEQMKIYESNKYWIKLEGQTSGNGNIELSSLDYDEAVNKINNLTKNAFSPEYIYSELPLIIERNASSGYEEEIINIGVEAIISANEVTILGGVAQKTDEKGKYIGSYYNEEVEKYLPYAIDAAKLAFVSYANEGYKGFIAIDVLVTKNKITNEIKAYNIDPNARFSGGLMLLKNIHMAEDITKKKIYGLSFTFSVVGGENIFENIKKCAGDNLYNKNTGTGLIPALLNDIKPLPSGFYFLKVTSIAHSYQEAVDIFEEFKRNMRKLY